MKSEMNLTKGSILSKTARVSIVLLFSKFLGVAREIIQARYLGVGSLSDAFNTAMKIPTLLRKIFAEGALSAAFVPTIVRVTKEDSQEQASRLMTLTFIGFGTLLTLICIAISLFPEAMIYLIADGFKEKPVEMAIATEVITILIYFVLFVFVSALFASALQAKMHFTIPAWGPALLNIFYIGGLLLCLYGGLSVYFFSYFLLFGGLVQTLVFGYAYLKNNFKFILPNKATYPYFREVVTKFIPCITSVSIVEINLIIDNRFASTLPAGSATLLSISSKFMTIALGAFAVAFSTILLPHFSRVSTYAPKRLHYYLLESTKFIFWVTFPVMILMSFFAYDIFYTIFYRISGISLGQVAEAATLLIAFLPGLFFFSVNKMLLNIFYAVHEPRATMYITIAGTILNVILNRLLMPTYGALGIAVATALAAVAQTIFFLLTLQIKMDFIIYIARFARFALAYMIQVCISLGLFFLFYYLGVACISRWSTPWWSDFLLHHVGLWLWVGPLSLVPVALLYYLRNKFGVHLHFLE